MKLRFNPTPDPNGDIHKADGSWFLGRNIRAAIILSLILAFLGLFHVVGTGIDAGIGITIIPKSHFTYANTFVTVSEVIRRCNGQSLAESLRDDDGLNGLASKLEDQGFIKKRPLNEELRARLRGEMTEPVPERGNSDSIRVPLQ